MDICRRIHAQRCCESVTVGDSRWCKGESIVMMSEVEESLRGAAGNAEQCPRKYRQRHLLFLHHCACLPASIAVHLRNACLEANSFPLMSTALLA